MVIDFLVNETRLPQKYVDHELTGNMRAIRECHVKPDTLLLYYVVDDQGVLRLYDIGSHADIFG